MRLFDADEMVKRLEEWNTADPMDKALYNFAMSRINEQPTVQPEPKWIPVTERLPEGDTVVLCSIPASDGYIERIAFGYYMRFGNLGWRMSDWLQNHGAYGAMQPEPIAWMPLPEPFREEGENE